MGTKINLFAGKFYYADVSNDGARMSVYKDPDSYYIQNFVTIRPLRNKGYATALLNRMVKWADKIGATLKLHAAPFDNEPLKLDRLIQFYEKAGFAVTERRQYSAKMERIPTP